MKRFAEDILKYLPFRSYHWLFYSIPQSNYTIPSPVKDEIYPPERIRDKRSRDRRACELRRAYTQYPKQGFAHRMLRGPALASTLQADGEICSEMTSPRRNTDLDDKPKKK